MTKAIKIARDIYHEVFVRDGHKCVYCNRDILESLDTFAASHLDHLKPKRAGGPDEVINFVIACGICNSMKGGFDPCEGSYVTEESFRSVVDAARAFIARKRNGVEPCSYVRDYEHWLGLTGRKARRSSL